MTNLQKETKQIGALGWINSTKTYILNYFGYGILYKSLSGFYRLIKTLIEQIKRAKFTKHLSDQFKNNSIRPNKILIKKKLLSAQTLKVLFAVSETGPDATAGDYFTALELGEALKKSFGWEIGFLSKNADDWYQVEPDVDILISMLESFDPRKIKGDSNGLLKIAWQRNSFEKWPDSPGTQEYNIICASSQIACDYIKGKTGRQVDLLPIATNEKRFCDTIEKLEEYDCEYCFTGSYWNDPRDIIELLDPQGLPYKFNLYGKNWDRIKKFKPYYKGFYPYEDMPKIYKSTKVVIDDANRTTKPFGAVNSRVFDALASGTLVLTNGDLGSSGTFEGKLPVFNNKEELKQLLDYYLQNEEARLYKVAELKKFVLANHTYMHRALELRSIIEKYTTLQIAIKIPAPSWEVAHEWGDYHVALGLKKNFEKVGFKVVIHVLSEWDALEDKESDVVIVLRGLSYYKPKPQHFNIMWNISHPEKVSLDEYNQYDYVFIASEPWVNQIAPQVKTKVRLMLQCTDPELFKAEPASELSHEILFVGNSRNVYRKAVRDAISVDLAPSVYGSNWLQFIDNQHIKGEHIPNSELNRYYSSCKILLNDHWDDMREKGFISNRVFDALACETFVISDKVKGIENVFEDVVVTYETKHELENLINVYLGSEYLRKQKALKGKEIVLKNHTYAARVKQFAQVIDEHFSQTLLNNS